MKKKYALLVGFYILFTIAFAQSPTEELLKKIPNSQLETRDTTGSGFKACWTLTIRQPLDHSNVQSKQFDQRIFISEVDPKRPVVFVTEGYDAVYASKKGYREELSRLYNLNLVVVEHRYFGKSKPDSLDYRFLNFDQVTADYHTIRGLLSPVFNGKWISTGISKGGQTALAYKAYYPSDVDATVAYVAPVNNELIDPRIPSLISKTGSDDCRKKITDFQKELLSQKEDLLPLYIAHAQKYKYKLGHNPETLFEYMVLEYPFSFWQWGKGNCDSIPPKNAVPEKMLKNLLTIVPLHYYTEGGVKSLEPFFYQAFTELGFYQYDARPFKGLLKQKEYPNEFFAPAHTELKYNPAAMKKVRTYLSKNGNHIIYISGENDPWGATAFAPPKELDALQIIKKEGSHTTRISTLPPSQQEEIVHALQRWIGKEISSSPILK